MNTGKIPQNSNAIVPYLTVKDIDAATAFYTKTFGFTVDHAMPGPDGKTVHAGLRHGNCTFMLGSESPTCGSVAPTDAKATPFGMFVYVEDVDKFFAHAKANGATVKEECTDQFWGDRTCGLVDPFNHHWMFATHIKEVAPEDMQAAMMKQYGAHATA